MYRYISTFAIFLLSACAAPKITDYSDRAVYYAWVDISDISGNSMTGFQIRNAMGPANEAIYDIGYQKMGNGYLVWHQGLTSGRYEFSKLLAMSCAGPLCTSTINEYGFGPRGSGIAAVSVTKPGVVFGGCYAFRKTKTGFFRPGEFDTSRTACGASNNQMLKYMFDNANDPLVRQRIQAAM